MKKNLLLLLSVFITNLFSTQAQIVNESVGFNSAANNDFVNLFNNGVGLNQITTNGITGGCLTVPATMNWGNDNAIYCSKYIADSGSYCRTSVSFKYDTSVFNSSGFDRAVSLFLNPSADFNHYVIASVSHSQRIEVLTYSWTNSPGPLLNLVHNHWYDFIVRLTFSGGASGDQIGINVVVTDLGVTGVSPPIPVNSESAIFNDSILFGDTAVQVSFTATENGGVKYIENFRFEGIKSADSCISIPTSIPEKPAADFSVFVSGNELIIQNAPVESKQVAEIYSASGQLIHSIPVLNQRTSVDVSHWIKGIYFIRLKTEQSAWVKKIAVLR